jgi:hypothetical protein
MPVTRIEKVTALDSSAQIPLLSLLTTDKAKFEAQDQT